MTWQANPYATATTAASERATFIRRTYSHLAGALGAFLILEIILFRTALPGIMLEFAAGGRFNWLMILGAFMLVGWLARSFAAKTTSLPAQYAGLFLYVIAEAVIFVPLIAIALLLTESPNILMQAALLTAALFAALSAVVFMTNKNFSFLGSILTVGGIIALAMIVCGAIFGFNLGLWFSAGMIVLAAGAILYDTSRVLHDYPSNMYVGASLELFASITLLLWYVLRLLISMRR